MRILLSVILIFSCVVANAQTKTTEALHKQYPESSSAFFYYNTLRMLNQNDDKDFDELIKDIEKMKFLFVSKSSSSQIDYKKIVSNYKSESFEQIMNSRVDGKNFDVFLKEESGKTKGVVITVNDSSNFFVLDIVGSIALNKIPSFFNKVQNSTEIGNLIGAFKK